MNEPGMIAEVRLLVFALYSALEGLLTAAATCAASTDTAGSLDSNAGDMVNAARTEPCLTESANNLLRATLVPRATSFNTRSVKL